MNANEFDVIHNDDENENYFCVDSQARSDISKFDYKIICVVMLPFGGTTTIDNITYNIFTLYFIPTVNYMQGKFSTAYDGACIRCLFDTYAPTMDTSLPFVIQASDQQTPPQPQYYHVYTDVNRQQKMQGLYKRGSVMDFVFDKTNQCFYLVGSAGEMNVQADWNQTNTSADDYIKNKPTIPAAQVNSDWNASSGVAQILNKPSLADVARSGEADDVAYDNSSSGMVATNVQDAVDSLKREVSGKAESYDPVLSGALSMHRRDNTTIGSESATLNVQCEASGVQSFASGIHSTASGDYSRAEGYYSMASGEASHAENRGAVASGDFSHCEGKDTVADGECQHVSGKYNIVDNADTYAEIIGNGTADNARSNARTLDWSGNECLAGDLTINEGTASEMIVGQVLASKADASDLPSNSGYKDDFTDVSLASNTSWTTLASFNLTKGVWLVEIAAEFQNNNANFRGIGLYVGTSTPSSPSGIRYSNTIRAVDGAVTNMTMCMPIDINSDRTIYILGRQNSGTTLTTKPRACWVKIMPR